jgi:hypothetical protein
VRSKCSNDWYSKVVPQSNLTVNAPNPKLNAATLKTSHIRDDGEAYLSNQRLNQSPNPKLNATTLKTSHTLDDGKP